MALVSFYTTTEAKYKALSIKDPDALYFLDNGHLYKGSTFIGSNVQVVDAFPTTGTTGVIYVIPSGGGAKVWTGSDYIDLTYATATTISSESTDAQVPTAKAVWEALAAITPDGYEEFQNKVVTIENTLKEIQNEETGILAQSKAYTNELAEGQVAKNADDIADLQENKANKATTIAGYGITDAYTKEETDSAIATAVADLDHLTREIVTELPSLEDAKDNVIYMVKDPSTSVINQTYNEYILINGVFELIGTTATNMSDYVTQQQLVSTQTEIIQVAEKDAEEKANAVKEDLEKQLADYKTTNDKAVADNKSAIEAINNEETGILAQAKEHAISLGENYATKEQGELADSALQLDDITPGTENGTIAVQGNNIAVTGLGSAAYHADTDFDAAGSAAAALTNAKEYADGLLTWKTIS